MFSLSRGGPQLRVLVKALCNSYVFDLPAGVPGSPATTGPARIQGFAHDSAILAGPVAHLDRQGYRGLTRFLVSLPVQTRNWTSKDSRAETLLLRNNTGKGMTIPGAGKPPAKVRLRWSSVSLSVWQLVALCSCRLPSNTAWATFTS